MEVCRVCMKNEMENMEMYSLFEAAHSEDGIIVMIQFCTGVLFTKMDVLPSKICIKCLEELHIAHKFKKKCLKADQMFHDLVLGIKAEPLEFKDNIICSDQINDRNTVCSDQGDIKSDVNRDDDVKDDEGFDYDVDIKVEDSNMSERPRKTKKVRLKIKSKGKDSVHNEGNLKTKQSVKGKKQCGTYNKNGPRRLAKLKFKKLYCESCNIKFASKIESDDHKKEFHNEPQLWICEICGKSFAHRSSQHSHMRIHYPPQYACDDCDYKTSNKHDLSKHIRIHTGKKSYICPICAAAYRTSSNLHAHVRLKHEGLRKHACTLCSRTFYDRTKLNRHLDSHNDVKRYSCEVCHSCFTRRCYWKKHLQKQHDIVIPSCRPGRPKTSIMLETHSDVK